MAQLHKKIALNRKQVVQHIDNFVTNRDEPLPELEIDDLDERLNDEINQNLNDAELNNREEISEAF